MQIPRIAALVLFVATLLPAVGRGQEPPGSADDCVECAPCTVSGRAVAPEDPRQLRDGKDVVGSVKLVGDDFVHVLGAPLHWDGQDLEKFAIGAGAVVGVAVLADRPISKFFQEHRSSRLDSVLTEIEPLGTGRSHGVIVLYAVYGFLFHDDCAKATAYDAFVSSLIAAGVISPVMKKTFGRARPYQGEGPGAFQPFGKDTSFPSGHATEAFAVASVIAAHDDRTWVQATAWSLASLVAVARVYHQVHWASDVVAGALIGTGVGNCVVHYNSAWAGRLTPVVTSIGDGRHDRLAFGFDWH